MNQISKRQSPQLYLITNDDDFDILYKKLEIVLASSVVSKLQIRRKNVQVDVLRHEIEAICALVDGYGSDCDIIINDDVQLAKDFGLGVHLGQEDGSIAHARKLLGNKAIIGRTCHGSTVLVKQAIEDGVSYVAMGAVFASTTKPNAKTIAYDDLQQGSVICLDANIDFCVIGGITSQNISKLNQVNIDYFAVVNDVLGGDLQHIKRKCQLWQRALDEYKL